jgi:transcriptional regulator with XRE-family HTH domain
MSLGSNIKNIRENQSISIKDISKRLKVFEKAYRNIESNIKRPTDELLRKLASVFNITVDDIKNYNEERARNDKQRLDLKNLKTVVNTNTSSIKKMSVNIGNVKFVPIETPTLKDVISKKPILLSAVDLFKYKNNLDLVGSSISTESKTSNQRIGDLEQENERVSSPRLLSYVEPYDINNIPKTLFYTEVNTNYKIGDRVFIIGGPYDIDLAKINNRYKKGRDGYKILFIDKCRVVLDINYTGELPFKRDKRDNFLNIYVTKDVSDFRLYSKQISTRSGVFQYKFSAGKNNILYVDKSYDGFDGLGSNSGIEKEGFYIRNIEGEWVDVTETLISSSYENIVSNSISSFNDRVRINNGNILISYEDKAYEFTEDGIYQWSVEDEEWVIDKDFDDAIITKSNFRKGLFNGRFNGGLYGTKNKKIPWTGDGEWNMGTLLNVKWERGIIKSTFTLPDSFISQFGEGNKPYEKINGENNNGSGFNFLFKSDLNDVIIENGNIYDTSFGGDVNHSVIEDYLKSNDRDFLFELNGGYYNNCQFNGGKVLNSSVDNCRSNKTKFDNITSINSIFNRSLMLNSVYLSDNSIKILDYDELVLTDSVDTRVSHKLYKFYINEDGYNTLKAKDKFYIKGLRIKDSLKYPLNFFNKRFKISSWTEYVDFYNKSFDERDKDFYKRGIEMASFLSTNGDNEFLHTAYRDANIYKNGVVTQNDKNLYSLDILVSISDVSRRDIESTSEIPFSEVPRYGLDLNNDTTTPEVSGNININNLFLTNKIRDYVDIENAFIVNSDFDSGLIENSDWNSGDHIELNNDNNISNLSTDGNNRYDITVNPSDSTLLIKTTAEPNNLESIEDSYKEGDVVYINQIVYKGSQGSIELPDTYTVVNDFGATSGLLLKEVFTNNSILSSIINSDDDTFTHGDLNNNYTHIHKLKISKSKIKGGIFRRSYITESLIENNDYDVSDIDFNNLPLIKSLVISDGVFKNLSNILSKGIYINSNFSEGSDTFEDGIIYNSVWGSGDFNNGVFKQSTWLNGIFNDGVFYDNRSFNGIPTSEAPEYNSNSLLSYYRKGLTFLTSSDGIGGTTTTLFKNNIYAWINGIFRSGEFRKSDWQSGEFQGGNFYNSKFYTGFINGGVLGKKTLRASDTRIYSGTINNTTVDNASLISQSPNLFINKSNPFIINWNNGEFNGGVFGSNNITVWNNGRFNDGEVNGNTQWKGGEFNGGVFLSTAGESFDYTNNRLNYAWQGGVFNGGVFGNASSVNNPSWWDGEFNGGEFQGKVWNNGIFTNGMFKGSGQSLDTISSDIYEGDKSENASVFVDSFLRSGRDFYGLWRNGAVTSRKDKFISNKKFFTKATKSNKRTSANKAILNGVLWQDGIFDDRNADMVNSVWLDGEFGNGRFINSSFNPFVNRIFENTTTGIGIGGINSGISRTNKTFNTNDSCIWRNGELKGSDFHISIWENGIFDKGNAYGMVWRNGTCLYMNAYNIFWEDGTWRNGNWYGSFIEYSGSVTDNFDAELIKRGIDITVSNECHIWNIFAEPEIMASEGGIADAKEPVDTADIEGENDFLPLPSIVEIIPIDGDPELEIGSDEETVQNEAGNYILNITSNISWNISAGSSSWVSTNPSSGRLNESVNIEFVRNTQSSPRTATIVISGFGIVRTFTLNQNGTQPPFILIEGNKTVGSNAGSYNLVLTSNVSWNVSAGSSWVENISPTNGNGSGTILVEYGSNSGAERFTDINIIGSNIERIQRLTQESGNNIELFPHLVGRYDTSNNACAGNGGTTISVWTDNQTWTFGNVIFTDEFGNTPALTGIYIKEFYWKSVVDGQFNGVAGLCDLTNPQ